MTDQINLRVARTTIRRRRREDIESAFAGALGPNPDPDDLNIYFTSVGAGWNRFFLGSTILGVALVFIGRLVDSASGEVHAFAMALFPAVTCLVGEADAEWRYYLARRAGRSNIDSATVARLTRLARSFNVGIVLQAFAGLVAAVLFWILF